MPLNPGSWAIKDAELAALLKKEAGNKYTNGLFFIFKQLIANEKLRPKLRFTEPPELVDYLERWVATYLKGYEGRPSHRKGKPSATAPDTLIEWIYGHTHKIEPSQLKAMGQGHATMMTLEKIVGDLLEEYLASELEAYGWHCCWGQTVKSVDFCHEKGRLLQIKTSDNSENSSSKGVRDNTKIEIWQRRKSRKKDQYYWDDLQEMTGNKKLSEDNFRAFVKKVLEENPLCVYVPEPE